MTLRSRLGRLPRLLAFEAALAVVILLAGVVPLAVFHWTPVSAPRWFSGVWRLPLAALGALWGTLLVHAAVDAVRFVRNHDDYDLGDSATRINAGFRFLATLGAVLAPVLPVVLFGGRGPPPQAGFAIVLVFVLAVPVIASGLVVLLHASWLGWRGPRTRCAHDS